MAAINVIKSVKPSVVADSVHTLAMMLEVGLGELVPVRHLERMHPKTDLGNAYARIAARIPDAGLSEAFTEETRKNKTIPLVVSELLAAGAETGKEAANLERAAEILQRNSNGNAKMRSALLAPIMSAVLVAALIVLLAVVAVPYMRDYYGQLGMPISPTANIIQWVSSTLAVVVGVAVVGSLGWGIFWLVKGRRSEKVRVATNRFTFKLPVWGQASKYLALNRFFDVAGPLLEAGVTETVVLERAAAASGSPAMRRVLLAHVERMRDGETTSSGEPATFGNFPDGEIFPLEISAMLTGAPSGNQQLKVLERLGRNYREKASTAAERVVRELPAMIDGFMMVATIGLTILIGGMMLDMTLGLTQYGSMSSGGAG